MQETPVTNVGKLRSTLPRLVLCGMLGRHQINRTSRPYTWLNVTVGVCSRCHRQGPVTGLRGRFL